MLSLCKVEIFFPSEVSLLLTFKQKKMRTFLNPSKVFFVFLCHDSKSCYVFFCCQQHFAKRYIILQMVLGSNFLSNNTGCLQKKKQKFYKKKTIFVLSTNTSKQERHETQNDVSAVEPSRDSNASDVIFQFPATTPKVHCVPKLKERQNPKASVNCCMDVFVNLKINCLQS